MYDPAIDISYFLSELLFTSGNCLASGTKVLNSSFEISTPTEFSEGACIGSPGRCFLQSIDVNIDFIFDTSSYVSSSSKVYSRTLIQTIYVWPTTVGDTGQIIAFISLEVPPSQLVVGGGWRVTRNNGLGWTDTIDTPLAQDHRKIINPNDGVAYDPDYIVVGMNTKIFRSSDRGTTWETIVIKEMVTYADLRPAILRVIGSHLYVLWENNIGL